MFSASSLTRLASCLAACALALALAAPSARQPDHRSQPQRASTTIPSDINSGGDWELVAKSSLGNFGIVGAEREPDQHQFRRDRQRRPARQRQRHRPAGLPILRRVHVSGSTIACSSSTQEPRPSGRARRVLRRRPIVRTVADFPASTRDESCRRPTSHVAHQSARYSLGDRRHVRTTAAWDIAAMFASGTFADRRDTCAS